MVLRSYLFYEQNNKIPQSCKAVREREGLFQNSDVAIANFHFNNALVNKFTGPFGLGRNSSNYINGSNNWLALFGAV